MARSLYAATVPCAADGLGSRIVANGLSLHSATTSVSHLDILLSGRQQQLLYYLSNPSIYIFYKRYRNIYYHKRKGRKERFLCYKFKPPPPVSPSLSPSTKETKNRWSRDDPAFVVLIAIWLVGKEKDGSMIRIFIRSQTQSFSSSSLWYCIWRRLSKRVSDWHLWSYSTYSLHDLGRFSSNWTARSNFHLVTLFPSSHHHHTLTRSTHFYLLGSFPTSSSCKTINSTPMPMLWSGCMHLMFTAMPFSLPFSLRILSNSFLYPFYPIPTGYPKK